MTIDFGGEKWKILKDKALFHIQTESLILGDLHIGKTSDFRKAGFAIPTEAKEKNILDLIELIRVHPCKTIVFLGDLFHGKQNDEFQFVEALIAYFADLKFILVRGNHEKDSDQLYKNLGLEVTKKHSINEVELIHEPDFKSDSFHISGHLHPGIRLRDKGRMSAVFPVLAIRNKAMVLPAWGSFTGKAIIEPKEWDQLYLFSDAKVWELG